MYVRVIIKKLTHGNHHSTASEYMVDMIIDYLSRLIATLLYLQLQISL